MFPCRNQRQMLCIKMSPKNDDPNAVSTGIDARVHMRQYFTFGFIHIYSLPVYVFTLCITSFSVNAMSEYMILLATDGTELRATK